MLTKLAEFFGACPYIEKDRIGISYLGGEPGDFAVFKGEGQPKLHKYADGGAIKGFEFSLCARCEYMDLNSVNTKTAESLENIENWISAQNSDENFPNISHGRVLEIKVLKGFTPISSRSFDGRFEAKIQLEIFYE